VIFADADDETLRAYIGLLVFLGFIFVLVITVGEAILARVGPRLLRRTAGKPKPGEVRMRGRMRGWADSLDARLNTQDGDGDSSYGDANGDGD
jgi:hypothetical protein